MSPENTPESPASPATPELSLNATEAPQASVVATADAEAVANPTSDTTPPERASKAAKSSGKARRFTRAVGRGLQRAARATGRFFARIPDFLFRRPVTFQLVLLPFVLLSIAVFTRSLWSNYIFDEQEALLANPYVNGDRFTYWQVFERDFWGLPHTRTIGSYRPLPNMIWRPLFHLKKHPWPCHFVNVLLHGVNAAIVSSIAFNWLKSRRAAWFSGLSFLIAAVITEAICGVVGLADVLSGMFILLSLRAMSLPAVWMFPATAVCMLLGLLAKESTIATVPMMAWAALVTAPVLHPNRPQRILRVLGAGLGALAAIAAVAYIRKRFFPVPIPEEYKIAAPLSESYIGRAGHEFLRWFQQPKLPADPINNPLVSADVPHRIAGALRVYFRGLMQVVFPWRLSGDYSFPQEPIPSRLVTVESFLGGLFMVGPPVFAVGAYLRNTWLEYQARFRFRYMDPATRPSTWVTPKMRTLMLFAIFALWIPFTFFPQSNIPLVLPTVRAERFWYIPVLGTCFIVGWAMAFGLLRAKRPWIKQLTIGLCTAFFAFQGLRARMHANDYHDDLVFWRATSKAVPYSGKAHLNYGVMLGARSRLDQRLIENWRALELAPQWPMASIYYGDTLCRMGRAPESWEHYKSGFQLGPNDQGLIALALQCMWDTKIWDEHKLELQSMGEINKGSWLAWLVNDMITNAEKNSGVDPKYRPRGYDGGPRTD